MANELESANTELQKLRAAYNKRVIGRLDSDLDARPSGSPVSRQIAAAERGTSVSSTSRMCRRASRAAVGAAAGSPDHLLSGHDLSPSSDAEALGHHNPAGLERRRLSELDRNRAASETGAGGRVLAIMGPQAAEDSLGAAGSLRAEDLLASAGEQATRLLAEVDPAERRRMVKKLTQDGLQLGLKDHHAWSSAQRSSEGPQGVVGRARTGSGSGSRILGETRSESGAAAPGDRPGESSAMSAHGSACGAQSSTRSPNSSRILGSEREAQLSRAAGLQPGIPSVDAGPATFFPQGRADSDRAEDSHRGAPADQRAGATSLRATNEAYYNRLTRLGCDLHQKFDDMGLC